MFEIKLTGNKTSMIKISHKWWHSLQENIDVEFNDSYTFFNVSILHFLLLCFNTSCNDEHKWCEQIVN